MLRPGGFVAWIDRQPATVITAYSAVDPPLQIFPGRMMGSISDAAAVCCAHEWRALAAYIYIYIYVCERAYGPAHRCCSVCAVLPLLLLVS